MDIQEQIDHLTNEIDQNKRRRKHILEIEKELLHLSKQEQIRYKELIKELDDVKRLERLNLKSLFNRFLGDLETRLDKERQEYLQAVLQHKSIEDKMQILKYEKKLLHQKLFDATSFEKELTSLILKKEANLKKKSTVFFSKVKPYEKQITLYKVKKDKYLRVMNLGERAMREVNGVLSDLRHVSDWGKSVRAMHGKGQYSSIEKKYFIDKARSKVVRAQVYLSDFEKDAFSLFHDYSDHLHLDSFEEFLDDFLDNLITDWVVQQKIKHSKFAAETVKDKLTRILKTLQFELEKIEHELELAIERKRTFVTAYK